MRTENLKLTNAQNPPPDMSILANISQSQQRRMDIHHSKFTTVVGLCSGWWITRPPNKKNNIWQILTKNPNETSEFNLEIEIREFPRFIVIESQEEIPLVDKKNRNKNFSQLETQN